MSSDVLRQRQKPLDSAERRRLVQNADGVGEESESIPSDANTGLLLKIFIFAFFFIPAFMLLMYVVFIPAQYYPVEYSLSDPPALEGALVPNSYLLKAEKLFEGKLIGAETIVHHKGHFYTGTADGKIMRFALGEIETVAHLGKKRCDGTSYMSEPTCGRPLGMKFDQDGYLVVIDTYSGLYRVNVATGEVHLLLPSSVIIDGRPLNFLNSLDIASDGTIYFTDSSVYQRRDYLLDVLDGRPTGRLLRYDPVKNSTQVLLDGLHFANGIQLSRYEDFLLICETVAARILKYNIKGINAGHTEIFVENLPGTPDNIRLSAGGGYWVGLPVLRHQGLHVNLFDFLASRTFIRFLMSKLTKLVSLDIFFLSGTMVVELNGSGEIVRALMDLEGKHLRSMVEVEDVAGVLYLGSFREPYVARIDVSRL